MTDYRALYRSRSTPELLRIKNEGGLMPDAEDALAEVLSTRSDADDRQSGIGEKGISWGAKIRALFLVLGYIGFTLLVLAYDNFIRQSGNPPENILFFSTFLVVVLGANVAIRYFCRSQRFSYLNLLCGGMLLLQVFRLFGLAITLVAVALFFVGRHFWREAIGFS